MLSWRQGLQCSCFFVFISQLGLSVYTTLLPSALKWLIHLLFKTVHFAFKHVLILSQNVTIDHFQYINIQLGGEA